MKIILIVASVVVLVGCMWGMWKIASYDFCPLYYGVPCLATNK